MKYQAAIFTNIAPHYSRSLWYRLSSSDKVDYSFYSSAKGFCGIKTLDIQESATINPDGLLRWYFLKNVLIGPRLIFQSGIISKCIFTNYDVYVLLGEMSSISSWIAAIICRLRKKPLIFWGHGLYGNENAVKKFFRLTYYRLPDLHFVYGNRARELMINSGFIPEKIITVYNSLDFKMHMELYDKRDARILYGIKKDLFPLASDSPVILFIGRLTRQKKIHQLIHAIHLCFKKGNTYNCLIVGDGTESGNLKELVSLLGLEKQVVFYGASYCEEKNAEFIMLSDCTVSPGNVGLTAMHSLSFGTPVITHKNFCNQGPEVEAVIQNRTGLYFEEDNVECLSDAIDDMIINRKKLFMERFCIEEIRQKWNPDCQAGIFDDSILTFNKY